MQQTTASDQLAHPYPKAELLKKCIFFFWPEHFHRLKVIFHLTSSVICWLVGPYSLSYSILNSIPPLSFYFLTTKFPFTNSHLTPANQYSICQPKMVFEGCEIVSWACDVPEGLNVHFQILILYWKRYNPLLICEFWSQLNKTFTLVASKLCTCNYICTQKMICTNIVRSWS